MSGAITPHKAVSAAGCVECKVCGSILTPSQHWVSPKDRSVEVGNDCDEARKIIYPDPAKVAAAEKRAKETLEERTKRHQEAVCRFVNAQGRHLSDTWKDYLAEEFDLEPDEGNPYRPLYPKRKK